MNRLAGYWNWPDIGCSLPRVRVGVRAHLVCPVVGRGYVEAQDDAEEVHPRPARKGAVTWVKVRVRVRIEQWSVRQGAVACGLGLCLGLGLGYGLGLGLGLGLRLGLGLGHDDARQGAVAARQQPARRCQRVDKRGSMPERRAGGAEYKVCACACAPLPACTSGVLPGNSQLEARGLISRQ